MKKTLLFILAVLLSGITAFANKGDIRVVTVNGTEGRFTKVGLQTQVDLVTNTWTSKKVPRVTLTCDANNLTADADGKLLKITKQGTTWQGGQAISVPTGWVIKSYTIQGTAKVVAHSTKDPNAENKLLIWDDYENNLPAGEKRLFGNGEAINIKYVAATPTQQLHFHLFAAAKDGSSNPRVPSTITDYGYQTVEILNPIITVTVEQVEENSFFTTTAINQLDITARNFIATKGASSIDSYETELDPALRGSYDGLISRTTPTVSFMGAENDIRFQNSKLYLTKNSNITVRCSKGFFITKIEVSAKAKNSGATMTATEVGTPNTAFPISTGEYTKMAIEGFPVTCQMVPLQFAGLGTAAVNDNLELEYIRVFVRSANAFILEDPNGKELGYWDMFLETGHPLTGNDLNIIPTELYRDFVNYTYYDNSYEAGTRLDNIQITTTDVLVKAAYPKTGLEQYVYLKNGNGKYMDYYTDADHTPFKDAVAPYTGSSVKEGIATYWWKAEGDPYNGFLLRSAERPDLYLSATTDYPQLSNTQSKWTLVKSGTGFAFKNANGQYLAFPTTGTYTGKLAYTATVDATSTFSKEDAWADIEAAIRSYSDLSPAVFAFTTEAKNNNQAVINDVIGNAGTEKTPAQYEAALRLVADKNNTVPYANGLYRITHKKENMLSPTVNGTMTQGDLGDNIGNWRTDPGTIFNVTATTIADTHQGATQALLHSQGLYLGGNAKMAEQANAKKVDVLNKRNGRLALRYADNAQYISIPKSGTAMSGVATVSADGTTDKTKLSLFSTSAAPYEGIYVKINKPANEDYKYSTFYADFAYEIATEGAKTYRADKEYSGWFKMMPTSNTVATATPIVIRYEGADNEVKLTPIYNTVPALTETNLFSGHFLKTVDTRDNILVMGPLSDGKIGFAKRRSGVDYLLPNRAFIQVAANAPVFKMLFDDEAGATTGIETIEQNTESKSSVIYDLQGRRVYEPLKSGVYIINGKKVVK